MCGALIQHTSFPDGNAVPANRLRYNVRLCPRPRGLVIAYT